MLLVGPVLWNRPVYSYTHVSLINQSRERSRPHECEYETTIIRQLNIYRSVSNYIVIVFIHEHALMFFDGAVKVCERVDKTSVVNGSSF